METGGVGAAATPRDVATVLLPYVPRLVAEWAQASPAEQWRSVRGTMVFADLSRGRDALFERFGIVRAEDPS